MMATENEFKLHPCSEKMKYLISDYLKNQSGSLVFDDSTFLLFQSQSNYADLYLMNKQFTAVSQSLRINQLSSVSCCTFIKKEHHFIFIYACKNEVIVIKFQENIDGFEPGSELCRVKFNFEGGDAFKVFSKPFVLDEGNYLVAYSEKDDFFLISLVERGRKVSLEVTKLLDQDRSSGLWSWLTRQKPPHYEQVKIVSLNSDNGYRILCVRDNTASVFHISVNPQIAKSSIKKVCVCNSLPNAINTGSLLMQAHLISQNLALLAYSFKQKLALVKLSILDEQNSLTIQKINTNAASTNFQVLRCKQHIYFTIKDSSTSRYKCLRFQLALKQFNESFEKTQPLFEAKTQTWLCGNIRQLFLINSHNIYQIEQESNQQGIPEEVKKYQSFEGWIDRTINKKIKKQTHLRNYFEVQTFLDQKQYKLIEEFKHLNKGRLDPTVKAKISRNIICTYIVKMILSRKHQFSSLLSHIQHPNIQTELNNMNQQSLIENLLINQTPAEIQCFLRIVVVLKMYDYLNQILQDVQKHIYREICTETINQIFSNVCSEAIHSFRFNYKTRNISDLKILMDFTFRLIKVEEESFAEDFIFLANEWKEEEVTFVHNLVLNEKLLKIFMHLFIRSSKVAFTPEEINQMIASLPETDRQSFLHEFLRRFREAYIHCAEGSPKKQNLMKKGAILVRGLLNYKYEIEDILQQTFPGLCAYMFLNSVHRLQHNQKLRKIAEKCTKPTAAYMLLLATPGDDKKIWKEQLLKIKLCKDLSMKYNHASDILKDIEENKEEQKKNISQQRWEYYINALEIPKERAVKLSNNLNIVP